MIGLEVVAHDVYHRAGYHRFAEATEGTSAFLAVIRGSDGARGVVWPYLLRSISDVPRLEDAEASDVDSVYGYPGPLAWGCRPGDGFTRGAVDAIVAVWRSQGALSAFTRFHPLLGNERWGADVPAIGPDTGPSVLELGETVAIDLRQDNDAAVAAYSKSLRQEIASARRAGMTTQPDEAWAAIGDFTELYRATMLRTRCGGLYFFSIDDFREPEAGSRLETSPARSLISTGQPAAAGLFTEHDGIVQAHLVGTNDEFRALSPLKLLLDDARSWASERGTRSCISEEAEVVTMTRCSPSSVASPHTDIVSRLGGGARTSALRCADVDMDVADRTRWPSRRRPGLLPRVPISFPVIADSSSVS